MANHTYAPQTTLEAVVALAHIVMRFRGEWNGAATSHEAMDRAVNQVSDLLPEGTRIICDQAVSELKRRAGHAAN